jgi:putative redox protein
MVEGGGTGTRGERVRSGDGAAPAGTSPAGTQAKAGGWENGRADGEPVSLELAGGTKLSGHLARPDFSAASGAGRHGVVLSHGFVDAAQGAGVLGYGYVELANRLASETGATVLTFDFRGTGASGGDVSLGGWLADLFAGIEMLRAVPGIEKIWLVGFATGGTLCMCAAGQDPSVSGVAAFASPVEPVEHGDVRRSAVQVRALSATARTDPGEWARELREIHPTRLVAKIPPRPLLVVHGTSDDVVPLTDARAIADMAHASAELRVLVGAGHMLLHDPRAIALLLGWFDRHLGASA